MIKKFLNDALKDPSVVKKLKEQGYDPKDIKSKKTFLAIINNSEKFDVQQMSIVTKKRKLGPGGGGGENPRISKFDQILKHLVTIDNRLEKVEDFITKQEKFNNWVVDVFNKNNLKV